MSEKLSPEEVDKYLRRAAETVRTGGLCYVTSRLALHLAEEVKKFYGLFSDYDDPCNSFEEAEKRWNYYREREFQTERAKDVIRAERDSLKARVEELEKEVKHHEEIAKAGAKVVSRMLDALEIREPEPMREAFEAGQELYEWGAVFGCDTIRGCGQCDGCKPDPEQATDPRPEREVKAADDSPDFVSQAQSEFEARGFERVNRGEVKAERADHPWQASCHDVMCTWDGCHYVGGGACRILRSAHPTASERQERCGHCGDVPEASLVDVDCSTCGKVVDCQQCAYRHIDHPHSLSLRTASERE